MPATFDSLVEDIRGRSADEKAELRRLLDKDLIEARRDEMVANHRNARQNELKGRLRFSSNVSELKKMLGGP